MRPGSPFSNRGQLQLRPVAANTGRGSEQMCGSEQMFELERMFGTDVRTNVCSDPASTMNHTIGQTMVKFAVNFFLFRPASAALDGGQYGPGRPASAVRPRITLLDKQWWPIRAGCTARSACTRGPREHGQGRPPTLGAGAGGGDAAYDGAASGGRTRQRVRGQRSQAHRSLLRGAKNKTGPCLRTLLSIAMIGARP